MKTTIIAITAYLITATGFAQTTTLKGKVSNPEGKAESSISVIIKGTNEGTFSDNDGNYKLTTNKALPLTLEFTSVEFQPYSIEVSNANKIQVTLQP